MNGQFSSQQISSTLSHQDKPVFNVKPESPKPSKKLHGFFSRLLAPFQKLRFLNFRLGLAIILAIVAVLLVIFFVVIPRVSGQVKEHQTTSLISSLPDASIEHLSSMPYEDILTVESQLLSLLDSQPTNLEYRQEVLLRLANVYIVTGQSLKMDNLARRLASQAPTPADQFKFYYVLYFSYYGQLGMTNERLALAEELLELAKANNLTEQIDIFEHEVQEVRRAL
ncbi:hypothetical protein IJH29_00855 [Candidatus Saccharibacteria bacterium]|nr:hypothetical protein [Candidatus Saccharibacteria bacterium]